MSENKEPTRSRLDGIKPPTSLSKKPMVSANPVKVESEPAPVVPLLKSTKEEPQPAKAVKKEEGWNWGAFALALPWGIAHGFWEMVLLLLILIILPLFSSLVALYYPLNNLLLGDLLLFGLPLLCLIILLALILTLGAKGDEWAAKNRNFSSVIEKEKVAAAWNSWGAVFFVIEILALAAVVYLAYADFPSLQGFITRVTNVSGPL